MARLRMTFHYAVHKLVIDRDLLGASVKMQVSGLDVTVVFPMAPEASDGPEAASPAPAFDERFPTREPMPLIEGAQDIFVVLSHGPADPSESHPVTIDLLRVEATGDFDLAASEYGAKGGASEEVWNRATAAMDAGGRAADSVIELLISWTRVRHRQVWLGLYGEGGERVGSDELVDLDAGRRLPWPARADMAIHVVGRDAPLRAGTWQDMKAHIERNEPPSTADLLLADAVYLAGQGPQSDPRRALLIAAVACEIRIKAVVREFASPEQELLIDLLLKNPRDWSLSVIVLFDKPLEIVNGHSLKADNRDLYKAVDALIKRRNGLAHRGEIPSIEESRESVKAAAEVFIWLAELRPVRATV
jgi:hypothetical protein